MADFTLLSNLQTSISGRSSEPDTEGEIRRKIALDIDIKANGEKVAGSPTYRTSATLLGAADIIAIDPKMIARVEPASGAKGVEPNYFPYVEFTDADFPWRYTLDDPQQNHITPWLALLALKAEEFRFLERGNGPLAKIEVFAASDSLPEPDQLWATVHVQVTRNASEAGRETDLHETIEADATAHFSRIICPRKLDDNTAYYLFLVPVYDSGRLTGLGKNHDSLATWNAYSWDHDSEAGVELPIYQQWRFSTSSMEDFESLVRRLSPNKLTEDDAVGATRTTYIGQPGYYENQSHPSATVEIEGALTKPGFNRNDNIIQRSYLSSPLQDTLNAVLANTAESGLEEDGPDKEDPLVALPAYGRHYTDTDEVKLSSGSPRWFHEANLDLRMRTGGGVGSRAVQRHQEDFMQQCWAQVGEINAANALRARLQAAEKITTRLVEKHITSLSSEVAISVCQPLLDLVAVSKTARATASAEIHSAGIPDGSLGRSHRRISAKRAHRNTSSDIGSIKASEKVVRTVPSDLIAGNADTRNIAAKTSAVASMESDRLNSARSKNASATHKKLATLSFVPEETVAEFASASVTKPQLAVKSVSLTQVVDSAVTLLETIPSKIASNVIKGTSTQDANNLEPIMEAPRITDPLASYITEEDPNFLLPNADALAEDSVTLTEENKTFIESMMLGANHEMNRELRWREFPTDMRATVFSRFWDSPAPTFDEANDDIYDVHLWRKALGKHFKSGNEDRLVLIIRGEVIRRYPDILVSVNQQQITSNKDWKAENGDNWYPVFSGQLDKQTSYFGFDLNLDDISRAINEFFFVIKEPPGRFRFGLDIGTAGVRQQRLDLTKAPVPFNTLSRDSNSWPVRSLANTSKWQVKPTVSPGAKPENWGDISWQHVSRFNSGYIDFDKNITPTDGSVEWGESKNSASLAKATFQKPVQAVVPARRLLDL